ncbi:MAG: GyrI-like domain-containing protein [Candidatus Thermoplasmatota archaeon]
MDYELIKKENMYLAGLQYYGTIEQQDIKIENCIDDLWLRFAKFCRNKWGTIEDKVVDPDLSYEIQIWNEEELKKEGKLSIFVGVEFEDLDEIPLELSGKVLPAGKYISFKLKGEEIKTWEEDILQDWFPHDDYWFRSFGDYLFHVQCFHEEKFKGVENLEESELEVLVPVDEVG